MKPHNLEDKIYLETKYISNIWKCTFIFKKNEDIIHIHYSLKKAHIVSSI